MIRFVPALVCLFVCIAQTAFGQQTIPVTTFTITELEAQMASLRLPPALRDDLTGLLDRAEQAYQQGERLSAVPLLDRFQFLVLGQPDNIIASPRAAELADSAAMLSDALESGLSLGGAVVGPDGGTLEVSDEQSPLFRTRLTIPAAAISMPTFLSMQALDAQPGNGVVRFIGSGLTLGPAGLALAAPVTLTLPYQDTNRDGIVDSADFGVDTLKVGVADVGGRIAFPRRTIDTVEQTQTVEIYDLSSYWVTAWRWSPGVLTYKLSWPARGVSVAPDVDMDGLADAVRSGVDVWASALAPAGISFQEVEPNQSASLRFGFFSADSPLSVLSSPAVTPASGLAPGLSRGLGDGAAQYYAQEDPAAAGAQFVVNFNGNFGSASSPLRWTTDLGGNASAVSIEAVAIHAIGHVVGLDDIPGAVQPPVMATGADLLRPEVCLSLEDIESTYQLYRVSDPNAFPSCPHSVLEVLPDTFDFGEIAAGGSSENTFTMTNAGTGSVSIRSITAAGGFELDTSETDDVLRPGESTSFLVRFQPSTPGRQEGVVRIVSNGGDTAFPVWLFGSGAYSVPGCELTPSVPRVLPGEPVTLNWTTTEYPQTGVLSGGVGTVNLGSEGVQITPSVTANYTLTVSNAAGSDTCDATVEVTDGISSEVLWTRQFGTDGEDVVRSVAAGEFGLFTAGESGGTVSGLGEGFLARYDIAGDVVWEERFAGARVEGLTVDSSGVYIAGLTDRTLDRGTFYGGWDVFVRKYDFDGNELWTDQFGTTVADRASSIAVDASGVYVAGVTEGAIEGPQGFGGLDVFIRKYSLAGAPQWTRQFGTPTDDFARDIESVPDGIVVVGDTGAALSGQLGGGGSDAFLRQYSRDGEEVWTRQFGAAGSEFIAAVTRDATGLYVAGGVETALPEQASAGGFDAFLRKYDWDGNLLWTRQFGTPLTDSASGLSADASRVYVVGATEGDLGNETFGEFDAFVRAYDATGTELWTRHIGTAGVDDAFAVSQDRVAVYVGGSTLGTFDGSTNAGSTDAYLGKIIK